MARWPDVNADTGLSLAKASSMGTLSCLGCALKQLDTDARHPLIRNSLPPDSAKNRLMPSVSQHGKGKGPPEFNIFSAARPGIDKCALPY